MFERFTERARQVVVLAQDESRTLKHNFIGTEHILLGLLREEEGLGARVLGSLGIDAEEVRGQVARIVGQGEEVTGQIPFTPRATKVLELALREAQSLGHEHIGTEHILLGLVRENEGVAARILLDLGADAQTIRDETIRMLGTTGPSRPADLAQTARVGAVLLLAQDEARTLRHDHVGTEHILLGLLREEESLAARVLDTLDITIEEVRAQVQRLVPPGDEAPAGELPLAAAATNALELAGLEALSLGHRWIGTEHVLLGLGRESEGVAGRILVDFDAGAEKIRNEVVRALSGPGRATAEVHLTTSARGDASPDFSRLTEPARRVVKLATDEARTLKHNYVGTEHILLGLLRGEEGVAAHALRRLGITVEEVRAQVARIVGQGDEVTTGQIPFTARAKKVLELALREALSLGQESVGTEHILLGLVRENEGIAARILGDFDADAEKVRLTVFAALGSAARTEPQAGLERFTERARQVVVLAGDEARAFKHNYIGPEHILLGLLREEEGLAARVLDTFDVTVEEVRAQVARIVGVGDDATTGQIPFTPETKRVLQLALREALSLGHNYIGTEHVLLGLVRENEGVAARVLRDFDADAEKIRNEIIRMLSGPGRRHGVSRGPVVVSVPCPACGRSLEQLQLTHQDGDTFTAERSGAAHCRHCHARFDLSYRIEWKPA